MAIYCSLFMPSSPLRRLKGYKSAIKAELNLKKNINVFRILSYGRLNISQPLLVLFLTV